MELRNASGVIVNKIEITSGCGVCIDDQCPTPLCSTSFDYDGNYYIISVTAFNAIGSSLSGIFNETIGITVRKHIRIGISYKLSLLHFNKAKK